ncbi:hypothetical protein QFC22_004383 [Naganishia vaughanmartiniae]|uniref:Uncharacterized protein n=1 Tax=Naganishia vaughanmartiniae TaxID=1424756 RepID=A0ACC2X0K7_9TREE|nr:hypothetical protein QFC22_004383 [Naganishia vaughanmartiniae]
MEEALQQLSDSLQTIMWPSMRRKAAPSVRSAPRAHERPVGTEHTAEQFFPVVFPSAAALDDAAQPPPPPSTALPNHFGNQDPMRTPRPGTLNRDGRAYVNPFDLSPRTEDALLAQEREELDTWLNTDTETKSDVESRRAGGKNEQVIRVSANDEKEQLVGKEQEPKGGFDDDFGAWDIRKLVDRALVGEGVDAEADDDEFSAFQSAPDKSTPKPYAAASHTKSGNNENDNIGSSSRPAVSASDDINDSDDDSGIPIDPTALLSHLQSLRVELAGVENEDERRARAGREVVDVMRGLGIRLDDLDLDLDTEGEGL